MLNDLLKKTLRWSLIFVFWVFLLSITVKGRTIFSYSNDILVQNSFVRMLDEELATLWSKISETAKVTFEEISKGDEDKKA